ncbi:unnamed protein product [Dibothriocephalus latus]|uniref:Uncharacterized protein n=1 Tax=Dibothriocephalus latus TaxID=60516 RepID=A0A3P7LMJ4_DIBLA|nr:unnamed protein product [Dibothriocephalus latus]
MAGHNADNLAQSAMLITVLLVVAESNMSGCFNRTDIAVNTEVINETNSDPHLELTFGDVGAVGLLHTNPASCRPAPSTLPYLLIFKNARSSRKERLLFLQSL